jgi:hypothetical protein
MNPLRLSTWRPLLAAHLAPPILVFALVASATVVLAQSGDDTRGFKVQEYAAGIQKRVTKGRPPAGKKKTGSVTYKAVGGADGLVTTGADLGVTIWRLRETRPNDDTAAVEPKRIAIRKKGASVDAVMIAERADSTTHFADGDLIRLSIEVPVGGFVYIIDRERYVDGGVSEPYLIFPSVVDAGQSDRGAPGRLLYVPNEVDYFELTSLNEKGPRKNAELFTVILSPTPIEGLKPLAADEQVRKLDATQFSAWERQFGGKVWSFEQEHGAGVTITKVERDATVRGTSTLTEADPLPQTVFHIARAAAGPVMLTIPVRIGK